MSIFLRNIFIIIQSTGMGKRERALQVELCAPSPKEMLASQPPVPQNLEAGFFTEVIKLKLDH